MMRNSDQGVGDPEVASVVPYGWAVDEGGGGQSENWPEGLRLFKDYGSPRLVVLLQEVFEKPAYDNVELLLDMVAPLGELTLDIEDFLDPELRLPLPRGCRLPGLVLYAHHRIHLASCLIMVVATARIHESTISRMEGRP
jgi:hypothetical protein